MSKQKVVLITGASSGLGKAAASLLARNGYVVFGTGRQPDTCNPDGYEMLRLNVCLEESVNACIQSLMEQAGRLDVLINNAGYGLVGAVEETAIYEAKSQFETNFFGMARMVRAVLPIMRQQGGGQIINVSSLAGLMGVPFRGFYSSSKYALEGYTEALRHEVKRFNIHVSMIEPSFFRTNFEKSAKASADAISEYSNMRQRAFAFFEKSEESWDDPECVARLIISIVKSRSPGLRYRIGNDAEWIPRLKCILPWGIFESRVRSRLRLDS